ncbi:serine/threonine-protein kinase [Streptomyces sp. NPDC046925]|uniref:serine/threonine-protein kinase n=1 Tax=Streptomyces sp. NPDC046925 TaxID=3155375 RepID=UPI0033E34D09
MGEVFAGRYELVDPIGRGGVGAVWRAWDHRRRRYVAAKVLQQSDAHTLLRFVREQALRIDHPHVLAPASWAADDDKVLFTMALVAGGSLAHVIGDYGPLPPRLVCTLLDQLLSGLAAVHAEGVVHRDIKPANILLEVTGNARPHLRLSDFGISMRKGEPRLTEANYVVGTPGYFAPEQMMGAEPDFPADLFAVGLVALHLLEGAKPDTQALVEHFADHGTPGAPQGVPEPLWRVVALLLQPDPNKRFRTATSARRELNAAVELLPEPGPDDEIVDIFDHLGPLPRGFGPDGPLTVPAQPDFAPPSVPPSVSPSVPPPPLSAPRTGSIPPTPPRTPPSQPPSPQPQPQQHSLPQPLPLPQQPVTPPPPAQSPHAPSPYDSLYDAPYEAQAPAPVQVPVHVPAQALGQLQGHQLQTHESSHSVMSPAHPVPAPAYPYTAHTPAQAPLQSRPASRRRRQKRGGPPAKVAIPMLLAALLCFAVGFWALAQT